MTLEELMKPNKYGTAPMLDIVGIGSITHNEYGYLMQLDGTQPEYLRKSTAVHHKLVAYGKLVSPEENVKIDNPTLSAYGMYLKYLKLATPEERVFVSAVEGSTPTYYYYYNGILYCTTTPINIMPNGTGWISGIKHGELDPIPVTFYLEDILYRLDLQDEVP